MLGLIAICEAKSDPENDLFFWGGGHFCAGFLAFFGVFVGTCAAPVPICGCPVPGPGPGLWHVRGLVYIYCAGPRSRSVCPTLNQSIQALYWSSFGPVLVL